ncbi:MAG: hypothetical protein HY825_05810 [Acidobacteria bacterium]|nr:hypothetical protein [Acidobacteriota bacterium]
MRGGTGADDPDVGPYLKFGGGGDNRITVADGGRIGLEGGCTLEVRLLIEDEKTLSAGGLLAVKDGSFSFALKDGKLNNGGMAFPKQRVATTSLMQRKHYPVDDETFFGATPIPVNRWVHLAVTYDERMKVIRTWVDGGVDRTRYLAREDEAPLLSDPTKAVEFLRGMKNVRVAAIKLSRGARQLGAVPPLEAYVQQLPFQDKIAVCVDHVDRSLPLPVEIAVILETPAGTTSLAARVSLDSHDRRQIFVDTPPWKGALHTLAVKAYARNQMIFSRSVRVTTARPGGGRRVNPDRSLTVSGKPLFPLVIYHVFPEDYAAVAEMGFNVVMPRGLSLKYMGLGGGPDPIADARACLDEARRQGVSLMVPGNTVFGSLEGVHALRGHPALLGWMGFDEPWGSLEKVLESYNVVKLLDPDSPVYCVQNNPTRFAETAEGADILAADSYPIPNVSLRDVAFRTAAAARAVAGLKPVWTILGQYGDNRPSLQELRCMAYLAVISGANGLGIYAWDERPDKKRGWYTKEHPEDEAVLRSVIQELKVLEKILLVPNTKQRTHFEPPNVALHAAVKGANGKTYLFVASDSRKQEEAVLSVEGLSVAEGVSCAGQEGGDTLHFERGRASLRLPPLHAGVYEIR